MKIQWEEIKRKKYIVINNKVYDIQEYLNKHPGGSDILIENLGTDATDIYEAIGHSSKAKEEMKKYYIGEVCNDHIDKSIVVNDNPKEFKIKYYVVAFMVPFILAFTILYFK